MSDEVERESPPEFVLKPEPLVVLEGDCAKFYCRLIGFPKPHVFWVINGNKVTDGLRYKIRRDGMHLLEIPKAKQSDSGLIEVYAKNGVGEAYSSTNLEIRPRNDDYRAVLKNSPNPNYDDKVGKYQTERQTANIDKVFEERKPPLGSAQEVVYGVPQTDPNSDKPKIIIKSKTKVKESNNNSQLNEPQSQPIHKSFQAHRFFNY